MAKVVASTERVIDAPANEVYSYLADMHQHQQFLPPEFSDFKIEQGGVGTGTVTSFKITAGGRTRAYRMQVSEPVPGRTLVETDTGSSLVTTFNVTPQGDKSLVSINTSWDGASGIGGFFERTFAPNAVRRMYAEALNRLNTYAIEHRAALPGPAFRGSVTAAGVPGAVWLLTGTRGPFGINCSCDTGRTTIGGRTARTRGRGTARAQAAAAGGPHRTGTGPAAARGPAQPPRT